MAGDIAAVVGLKDVRTGDTLCEEATPVFLEPLSFPEPVVSMAIEPKARADQGKLGAALAKLADEDPTFHVSTDAETGQTLVAGMGELHLEIIREKLVLDHGVETATGQPRIAYRETITRAATGKGEQVKQSGGSDQFAKVTVQVAPRERSEANRVEDHTAGGVIPGSSSPRAARAWRRRCRTAYSSLGTCTFIANELLNRSSPAASPPSFRGIDCEDSVKTLR